MGLYDKLKSDVTAGWPPHLRTRLTLDADHGALNGVALGTDVFALLKFGRPSNPHPRQDERFIYRESAFLVETRNGRVNYFAFVFVDADEVGLSACEVRVKAGSREALLTAESGAADLLSLFGSASSDSADEDERILTFRRGIRLLEAEITPAGRLARLNVFPAVGSAAIDPSEELPTL